MNHECHKPPEERENPPFNRIQIEDAENDERGLLSTYDLFKLYFNIEGGFISKKDARSALFKYGLVKFDPSNSQFVAKPAEIHHGGFVVIFELKGVVLAMGMSVIVVDNGRCRWAEIIEIQVDGQSVEVVKVGEIGVKLSERVNKDTELWLSMGNNTDKMGGGNL